MTTGARIDVGDAAPAGRRAERFGRLPALLGQHWPALLCIGLASLVFFWPLVTPDDAARMFVRAGDFTRQFYAYHSFAAQEWWAGRVPLWNPNIFAGHPFLADIQTAVFYPPALLWAFLFGSDGLSFQEVEYRAVLAYPMAGVFCYLLVHELTRSRAAALLGGLSFAFSGFLTSYPMQSLAILETAIWLPLSLFFVERYALRKHAVWLVAAGGALAVTILAGHPQTLLLTAYTVTAYLVYRRFGQVGLVSWRSVGRTALATLAAVLVMWAIAVGLAAVQLAPTLEFLYLSNRASLPYEEAAIGYTPSSFLALLLPDWHIVHGPYVGIFVLPLATAGIARVRNSSKWFWVALALVSILLSLGGNGPLYPLLHKAAPGFAMFRDQERSMILFSLAVSVLAGLGFNGLGKPCSPAEWPSRRALLGLGSAMLVVFATAWLRRAQIGLDWPSEQVAYAVAFSAAGLLIIYLQVKNLLPGSTWLVSALALVVVDLFAVTLAAT